MSVLYEHRRRGITYCHQNCLSRLARLFAYFDNMYLSDSTFGNILGNRLRMFNDGTAIFLLAKDANGAMTDDYVFVFVRTARAGALKCVLSQLWRVFHAPRQMLFNCRCCRIRAMPGMPSFRFFRIDYFLLEQVTSSLHLLKGLCCPTALPPFRLNPCTC